MCLLYTYRFGLYIIMHLFDYEINLIVGVYLSAF